MSSVLKHKLYQYGMLVTGSIIFPVAVNCFIEPCHLNTGGFVGLAQILSYLVTGKNSLTGLVNMLINIPLFILAWKTLSKGFVTKTLLSLIIQNILFSIIPVPETPIMPDVLSNVIFASVIGGVGIGLCLQSSGSAGGLDILGVWMSRKNPNFSVGKLSYLINFAVLAWYAVLFDLRQALYSLIFLVMTYFVCDKVHYQNINVYGIIITKDPDLKKMIMKESGRGVTYWMGKGAYTDSDEEILLCMMNRYEVRAIRRLVKHEDPKAFFLLSYGNPILGNFEKRLIVS